MLELFDPDPQQALLKLAAAVVGVGLGVVVGWMAVGRIRRIGGRPAAVVVTLPHPGVLESLQMVTLPPALVMTPLIRMSSKAYNPSPMFPTPVVLRAAFTVRSPAGAQPYGE